LFPLSAHIRLSKREQAFLFSDFRNRGERVKKILASSYLAIKKAEHTEVSAFGSSAVSHS
jgi:hypothetical protein